MSLQYSITVNNARLDQIETTVGTSAVLKIFTGAVPANCAAADPSGLLCTITLPSDWMANAASASKAKTGTWSATASSGASATPVSFRIYDSTGTTCHLQGSSGISSGDLQLNGSVTSGQTVTVSSFTLNAANT